MGRAFPALARTCRAHSLHFNEVDLRWGIERDVEEPVIVSTCLREVEGCAPYILCLLGERYGWVPDAKTVGHAQALLGSRFAWLSEEGADVSVTHLEIMQGVLRVPAEHRRAFVYVRERSYLDTLPSERRPDFVTASKERADQLDRLKTDLRSAANVVYRT